jgi:hypothetical protein
MNAESLLKCPKITINYIAPLMIDKIKDIRLPNEILLKWIGPSKFCCKHFYD